ncbi:MAG: glycoside hydrolase family 3 C-terminal domain-containing protein [Candidatus Acidiferrum sp.]
MPKHDAVRNPPASAVGRFNRRNLELAVAGVIVFFFLGAPSCVAQTSPTAIAPVYLDPSQPTDVRVADLVSRMTLEEKASQLVNQSRAIPRLMIPKYDWRSEALHGIAGAGIATVFPEPVGLAATFDVPLIHEMALAIGKEGRAKHNKAVREGRRDILEGLDFWAPNINIARDPRWGRGQETYGEDPFLTGQMAVAFVTGLQGDDPKYLQVIATPKHFAVHSGPEPSRHIMNVEVSRHDLQDTYLPAFRAAVVEGKAGSVMCAYNRVNGEPACANGYLLENQLRGAWKFEGYVVGDCDSVEEIYSAHHYVKTFTEAGALSLKRGMDNECIDSYSNAVGNTDYVQFLDAVSKNLLSEKDIDLAVKRLFKARFRLGEFDPPAIVRYANTADSEIDSEAHRALALKAARESMVLLKNDGILPLSPNLKKIAVIGPSAESSRVQLGNYSGSPSRVTTALDGIRKVFPAAQVTYTPGMNLLREETVVPAAVFATEDGQPGLTGEYYQNKEFKGEPSLERVDRYVNLEPPPLSPNSLAQPPGPNEFSVRWTGYLTPAESGTYQFRPTAFSNRLWFDGKLIIDTSTQLSDAPKTATVSLEKGHRYPLKLEAVSQDDGGATLLWLSLIANPVQQAVASTESADAVVAIVGITSQLEGEELQVSLPGFKGGDRTTLDLPREEEELLQAVKNTGKPLVVVLMNGSALSVNWAEKNANAIVDAWYPGEEGGAAIAETLAGTNNPAGRLPITFYKSVDQLPAFEDYSMKNRTYRYFAGQPLYPFGYGLSYSKFAYSKLKVAKNKLDASDPLSVQVNVKNTGGREGDEVIELYLIFPKLPGAPRYALRGFQRVHLRPRETQNIRFTLNSRDLSLVSEAGDRIVAPGAYHVSVGGGQPGTGVPSVQAGFTIRGQQNLPD